MSDTVSKKLNTVGIIVARLQVHELHDGHKALIQSVCDRHSTVAIFLGVAKQKGSLNNPLDFQARRQMVLEEFPNINVFMIEDMHYDTEWSKELDKQIRAFLNPGQTPLLYGSRDSFIAHYRGSFKTVELESTRITSGKEVRDRIRDSVIPDKNFRAGAIWATSLHYPKVYPTVDIAIYNDDNEFLFARKPNEEEYRFVGGFVSPLDASFEDAAIREAIEETGLELELEDYIGSCKIKDWRYEGEQDCIMTSFFLAKKIFGMDKAQDDIEDVKWVSYADVVERNILVVEEHRELLDKLIKYIETHELNKYSKKSKARKEKNYATMD